MYYVLFGAMLPLLGAVGTCRPKCDGTCGAPVDMDDCALCCTTENAGLACCARSYPLGSDERVQCENMVTARWSGGETGGPDLPIDPNAIVLVLKQ
ncbi:MAG: hypothetical protein D6815_11450 [Candidatus Dadabacteria bacterium]|nr:MAG: hypothetical protein D6815_11450 [Candidatus Dadabacteria bacterium]